jgi:hypothetical protein
MTIDPQIMIAVEQLGYQVTSGDVAARMGINIEVARTGLLALANATGGHLQVTNTGEIIYDLPRDFRQVLDRKYWQFWLKVRLEWLWNTFTKILRMSFGVFLISSIAVVYLAICGLSLSGSSGDCGDCDGCGNCVLDIFPSGSSQATTTTKISKKRLNFLEAVFSFIFGDGNPNSDLEHRRWRYIGNLIARENGAIFAEQVAPFLDNLGTGFDREYEQYMLPILTKFNGIPEVSPTGQLVYHFPELAATLRSDRTIDRQDRVPACLQERRWNFSKANDDQKTGTITLGIANIVGIIILSSMVGISPFGSGLIGLGLGILSSYGVGFLVIPGLRYFWVKYQDRRIKRRNRSRRQALQLLTPSPVIEEKLNFARQFATRQYINSSDIIYRSDEDAIDQQFFD